MARKRLAVLPVLAGASAVLLVFLIALWVKSYIRGDQIQNQIGSGVKQSDFAVRSVRGTLTFSLGYLSPDDPMYRAKEGEVSSVWPIESTYSPIPREVFDNYPAMREGRIGNVRAHRQIQLLGVGLWRIDMGSPPAPVSENWELTLPTWLVAVLLVMLPGFWVRQRRRARAGGFPVEGKTVDHSGVA